MPYNPRISKQKAVSGSIDGAIAALLTAAVAGAVKSVIVLDAGLENAIALLCGAVVASGSVALRQFWTNRMKHKADK